MNTPHHISKYVEIVCGELRGRHLDTTLANVRYRMQQKPCGAPSDKMLKVAIAEATK